MDINQALVARIQQISQQKNISLCDMSLRGGLTPSTLYEIMNGRTKCPTVLTIYRLCQGAGITMAEFFDCDSFDEYFE